jgi:anti-anti-sigma regulatory factor
MLVKKEEKYIIIKLEQVDFDAELASKFEKTVAGAYSGEGMINFIADLEKVQTVSDAAITLFNKIKKITKKESGLFVLATSNDDLLDNISGKLEEHILMLPTVEEAIDAVFMNELENEFKEEGDEEFGTDEHEF